MSKLIIENVRCIYVFVNSPNKKEKYGVCILVKKGSKQAKKVEKMQLKTLQEKFGSDVKPKRFKLPLRDGDEERDGEEYEGMMFFNANSDRRPGIANKKGQKAMPEQIEEHCFSGAYFTCSVNFYTFSNDEQKGVAVGLNNIMMLQKEANRLDGSASAESDFADYANNDDDDDDDLDDEFDD